MKYEVIEVDQAKITVDVSLLSTTEEMFFNATQMARPFGKKVNDFLRLETTKEYLEAIFKVGNSRLKKYEDLIQIKKGRYGGTFLHNELAFEFAGWCSAIFRRNLHKWAEDRLRREANWKRRRMESKTGFLPMTDAILKHHDNIKPYHFSNEADLINRIALGMPAKKFKQEMGVKSVRDAATPDQLIELIDLQLINTGLIKIGMSFKNRKEYLTQYHNNEMVLPDEVA
jgi:hypothetical protein